MFEGRSLLAKRRREVDASAAAWILEVREYDLSREWEAEGFQNAAAAIRSACNLDASVAHTYVRLAQRLEQLPEVADAFLAGEISERHASVVAGAYTSKRASALADVEDALVEAARTNPPKDLVGIVKYVTDAIDGDGGANADKREQDARACYVANTLNGTFDLKANSDKLSGDIVMAALEAAMAQDLQAQDPRTTPQRRFDALSIMSRYYLEQGGAGFVHGIRPHVVVVVETDELAQTDCDTEVRVPSTPRRNGYSSTMLELLLCDCDVSRVVMAGRSEVLDVGRATRTATAAQWKALVARDRHCTEPGCTRPPSQCEAHHLDFWEDGGRTDIDNLRLKCWDHHRKLHIDAAQARAHDANRDP